MQRAGLVGAFGLVRRSAMVNARRSAGGFNSKFDCEKKWDERRDDNPFYAYDPAFTNSSLVGLSGSCGIVVVVG